MNERLATLLQSLGLDAAEGVRIHGDDYVATGPHRLASASAVALAAVATATAHVWRARTGRTQTVEVHTGRALQALRCFTYVTQNGYPLGIPIHAPLASFNRTRDGRHIYIAGLHALPHFLDGALDLLQCANTEASVAAALARWDSFALEEALAARRIPSGVVRSENEWRAHPQAQWLAQRPVVEIEKISESAPEPLGAAERPLAGIRVLDMTHVICGPMLARTLAEQGADVLHVGSPAERDAEPIVIDTGWGKRNAYADLDREGDPARLREVLRGADFLVQSWRPGALDRHGLAPAQAAALRPGLIYVSVSCYGYGGPWGGRGGYDPTAQAVTGIALEEALDGRPRQARTLTINDYLAAYLGTAGALAALLRRAREGGSYHVKVALCGSSMWLQQFGRIDGSAQYAALPWQEPVEPEYVTSPSAYGVIRSLAPPIEYSDTPARWDRAPEPPGASTLTWLPR